MGLLAYLTGLGGELGRRVRVGDWTNREEKRG